MLDVSILGDFDILFGVERAKLNRVVEEGLNNATAKLNAHGMLLSGAGAQTVTRVASDTLPLRAQTALTIMLRALGAHHVQVTPSVRDDALAKLTATLREDLDAMLTQVEDTPSWKSAEKYGATAQLKNDLVGTLDLEIQRIAGELSLIVAAASRTKDKHDTTSMVFNAPVGVVQTGPGSFGIAHQHLDAGSIDEVREALEAVRVALDASDADPETTSNLVEVIGDAEGELGKPKPNTAKLRGLVSGLGSSIEFLPKLRPAYDTLKWAAAFIGVTLP